MEDSVLLGMAFPNILKTLIESWLLYKIVLSVMKHLSFWKNVWHKPLFCFSLYLISLSLFTRWI
ncbi:DUF1656 domain-containing protein [Serratia nematodiphila]|uniref:DUF1656 domain-containing protein n=1 Tax=Serratia nematodiphila TaxID=458197 RepID=UPI0011D4775E|nr:DUF1656 domain-containing protein [Serratia nematodiphila]